MVVGMARAVATSTDPMGTAGVELTWLGVVRARTAPASSTVPQAWHSPHLPTHFVVVQPQSVQRYGGVTGLAMQGAYQAVGSSAG